MSHLGVAQSLSMVRKQQNIAEVKSFAPSTWTFFVGKFNKSHGSHSIIYSDSNTDLFEVIDREALL